MRRPSVVYRRLRIIVGNGRFRRERERWLAQLTDSTDIDVRRYVAEIERDRKFLDDVRRAYRRHTAYFPLPTDFMTEHTGGSMFFHFVSMYALVRLVRPAVVVETGGTPGKSSAFILRAMDRNQHGELYTIDLPPSRTTLDLLPPARSHDVLPVGLGSNWCVPNNLRNRQHLLVGPAQESLPDLLNGLRELDLFIHDSDHSYEHMTWEYKTVWPFLRAGGYLLSDDIKANRAWSDWCQQMSLKSCDFINLGVVHKPD